MGGTAVRFLDFERSAVDAVARAQRRNILFQRGLGLGHVLPALVTATGFRHPAPACSLPSSRLQ